MKKEKPHRWIKKDNPSAVEEIVKQFPSKEDPMGMYTGTAIDETQTPVQDSDDL